MLLNVLVSWVDMFLMVVWVFFMVRKLVFMWVCFEVSWCLMLVICVLMFVLFLVRVFF